MTKRARARLFVALDPPAWVRQRVFDWARTALAGRKALRRVDAETLHVTLCFLGSRPVEEIDEIAELALAYAAPVDGLELGAPLWLPPRRPRALAIEVRDADGAVGELQARVSAALAAGVDWEPEWRRYRAHLTVARMPEGAAPRQRELSATPALGFSGEALTLYRSHLARSGATYEALARVAL